MTTDAEIEEFLRRHLKSILDNDLEVYHQTTSEDLTLYEWWVTPHRIDGLAFHDFMMDEHARLGTSFGAEEDARSGAGAAASTRFDLANLHIQRYGDAAIASYTFLRSSGAETGVRVAAHHESRVMVKQGGGWKVVHVHKSPAWQAPYSAA
ncbi:MAG: hypothetical protein B6D39_13215 [Anaerolineae bacterium UTCFX2]|jgi:hypothetical protein|nr:nuclear transport factor 2 family protein [Anaerolineales bacterium]OQY87216.1 MAG: hypothetical protein B6D39_13215 [Anaerolineae bacterium UTCFX2]